jgi:hypothetical protein
MPLAPTTRPAFLFALPQDLAFVWAARPMPEAPPQPFGLPQQGIASGQALPFAVAPFLAMPLQADQPVVAPALPAEPPGGQPVPPPGSLGLLPELPLPPIATPDLPTPPALPTPSPTATALGEAPAPPMPSVPEASPPPPPFAILSLSPPPPLMLLAAPPILALPPPPLPVLPPAAAQPPADPAELLEALWAAHTLPGWGDAPPPPPPLAWHML